MVDTLSWGWYFPTSFPFPEFLSQDVLDESLNGYTINNPYYIEYTIRDGDNDGVVNDDDLDIGPLRYAGDYIIGPTKNLYPQEIALYTNSSIVMNGQVITGLDIEVTLFTDGTWGYRLMDSSIPQGHYSAVSSVTIGTWNGVEYTGIYTAGVDQMFVCYLAGTTIQTARGWVPVQQFRAGDLVETMDHGLQPIRWVGQNTILGVGKNAPVRIATGVLDNEVPVYVSPNHRLMIHGPFVELLFGEEDVLVAAKHLIDGDLIRSEPRALAHYVHFALDQHDIVMADGLLSESLLPGPEAIKTISEADRAALLDVFPVLRGGWEHYGPAARMCLTAREAELLRWAMEREGLLDRKSPLSRRPERETA